MRIRILAGILACAWMAYGQAPQSRAGVRRYNLNGTIVDGVSNRPIAGASVTLQSESWEAIGDPVLSDSAGRFGFSGLAAGRYILSASSNKFGTVSFGEAPDPGWVSSVQVGGDGRDKTVTFAVMPRAAITGVVRDEFSDPMVRAGVFLFRPVWRQGRTILTNAGQKMTDDRGRYRFGNLAPGNYVVCTTANVQAAVQGPVDYTAPAPSRFYSRACFPNSGGTPTRTLALAPGQEVQVDLAPVSAAAASVRGRVTNVPPMTGFSVRLESEDMFETASQSYGAFVQNPGSGDFVIQGVIPGHYRLRANVVAVRPSGGQEQLTAELPVNVGGADVNGLEVTLSVAGRVPVTTHGLPERAFFGALGMPTLLDVDIPGRAITGSVENSLTARFPSVPPGRYWFAENTGTDNCVESVKAGGREVRDSPIEVSAGAEIHLDVTTSRNCGTIQLRAVRGDAAVPAAQVVLLLSGTPQNPRDVMQDFADDQGEISFEGLRPGRYLLWAWDTTGGFSGPASLADVERAATAVEVTAGNPVKVDVPVLPSGGKGQ